MLIGACSESGLDKDVQGLDSTTVISDASEDGLHDAIIFFDKSAYAEFGPDGSIRGKLSDDSLSAICDAVSCADIRFENARLRNQVEALNGYARWEGDRDRVMVWFRMTWYSLALALSIWLIFSLFGVLKLPRAKYEPSTSRQGLFEFYNRLDVFLRRQGMLAVIIAFVPTLIHIALLLQELSVIETIQNIQEYWYVFVVPFTVLVAYGVSIRWCHEIILRLSEEHSRGSGSASERGGGPPARTRRENKKRRP